MQGAWTNNHEHEINEARLVANFKKGDFSNNELTYLLSHITRFIRRSHTQFSSEADDIASEAVLIAYKNLEKLQTDAHFFAWVKGIARHIVLHKIAKSKGILLHSRDAALGHTNDESPEEAQALQEQTGLDDEAWLRTMSLKEARASLSEQHQAVIALRIDEQQSSKEVAEQLNISAANVRQIEVRACRKMREYLTLNGYADLFKTGPRRRRQPAVSITATCVAPLSAGV